MQHIADWLDKLGMSEYAQRFAENRIDFSVLPDLTDQHLKDLGIALGDRLKMLRAIRDLGNASVAVTAPSALAAAEPTRKDHCRTPPTHRDVLRSRRLDRALGAARSRGSAGGHPHLSSLLSRSWSSATAVSSPGTWATGC